MKDSPLFFSRSEDLGTQRFGPAVEYKDKLFKRHAARIRRPSAGFCGVWRRHIMHYVDSGRELPRSAAAFPEAEDVGRKDRACGPRSKICGTRRAYAPQL